jgi:vancomycin resistance protein YoaR
MYRQYKRYWWVLAFIIPLVVLGAKIIQLNQWAAAERIHDRVYIYDIPVGGLTKEQALQAVAEKYQPPNTQLEIRFLDNDRELSRLSFAELHARYDFDGAIQAAWQYGRTGGSRFKARLSPASYRVNVPPVYRVDHEKIESFIENLQRQTATKPVNAALVWQDGKVAVVNGQYGRAFNAASAIEQTRQLLKEQSSGDVLLSFEAYKPAYTSADLQFDIACLGRFETTFQHTDDDPRIQNIKIAAGRIHNQTLYPGEVFSTALHIASGSPQSGYQKAVVLVNGQPTEDTGGGVCQVVTTLYNAVLYAELPITERHNHSAKVGYAEYGFDATVAGDYYDLKFKNDTPYPLLVTAFVHDDRLEVALHGYDKRPAERTLSFAAQLVEVFRPEPQKVQHDPTIPAGEIWVYAHAQDGYHYELYKHIYENGKPTGKVKVNSSKYKPVQGVVAVSEP